MRGLSILATTALVACATAHVVPHEFKMNSEVALGAEDVPEDGIPEIYSSRQGMMFMRNRPVPPKKDSRWRQTNSLSKRELGLVGNPFADNVNSGTRLRQGRLPDVCYDDDRDYQIRLWCSDEQRFRNDFAHEYQKKYTTVLECIQAGEGDVEQVKAHNQMCLDAWTPQLRDMQGRFHGGTPSDSWKKRDGVTEKAEEVEEIEEIEVKMIEEIGVKMIEETALETFNWAVRMALAEERGEEVKLEDNPFSWVLLQGLLAEQRFEHEVPLAKLEANHDMLPKSGEEWQ